MEKIFKNPAFIKKSAFFPLYFIHFCFFVLAQAHRDPLCRIKDFRKLECLSEKRFEELKKIIKKYVFWSGDKRADISIGLFETQQEAGNRSKAGYTEPSYLPVLQQTGNSFLSISLRERIWWDKDNWEGVEDREDPWGDLNWAEGYHLKRILKGEL